MSLPEIVRFEPGQIIVKLDEIEKTYKNCRIWAYGSDQWYLGFNPLRPTEIQFNDFADLLLKCPQTEYIILSTGINKTLYVYPQTLNRVSQKYPDVKVVQLKTKDAVKIYNQLRIDHQIIALFYTDQF